MEKIQVEAVRLNPENLEEVARWIVKDSIYQCKLFDDHIEFRSMAKPLWVVAHLGWWIVLQDHKLYLYSDSRFRKEFQKPEPSYGQTKVV